MGSHVTVDYGWTEDKIVVERWYTDDPRQFLSAIREQLEIARAIWPDALDKVEIAEVEE